MTEQITSVTRSPVPGKKDEGLGNTKILMNFYTALKEVVNSNKRMTRVDWQDANAYGFMKNEYLHIRLRKDGDRSYTEHNWIVSTGDLIAEDWFILD